MSHQNPELQSPIPPSADSAIQPDAPDFVETPDIQSLSSQPESMPIWLYLVCGFCLFMAGSSFTGFATFGFGLCDQGPGGPVLGSASQSVEVADDPMSLGKRIYNGNCANCHQAGGMGQPGSYPPLAGSEWVLGSKERLAAILLHGVSGPITVKGGSYGTQQMQAWDTVLTPEKIADVMTYLRKSWGNTGDEVKPDEVTAAKAKFASQSGAWNEADLLKIAPHDTDSSGKK